jgi:hypothetical protein
MMSVRCLALALAVIIGSQVAMAADGAPPVSVAIVVHPDTNVGNLTMAQLRRVFMAEQQFWDDDSRITLLVRAPGAYERDLVMDRLYRMDEAQFRKYWIAKMFRAEVPSGPRIVFSSNMAMELVKAIPGSITFVNSQELDVSVKVVTVDGLHPDDEGYPLR